MLRRHCLPLLIVAVNISACSSPTPDRTICNAAKPILPAIQERNAALAARGILPADSQAALTLYAEACVRRWAYRLAASEEPIDALATSTLGACRREIAAASDLPIRAPGGCEACVPPDKLRLAMLEQAKLALIQAQIGGCRTEEGADVEEIEPEPRAKIDFAKPQAKVPAS